jgi:signal transduction histidine kinase
MISPSKILIVDDKNSNLEALNSTLESFGLNIEVFRANNAEEALRLALLNDFAIALLDVQMPEIDGFELADMLRSSENTKKVPIIFISAVHCDDFFAQRGYEHGALDYLIKPVMPPRLFNKVTTFVALDQQARELEASKIAAVTAREQAESESQAKTTFLSTLSHELRTPLNAILGFGQLLDLEDEEALTDDQSDSVDQINRGGRHILGLVDQLLDLAYIESSQISLSIDEIHLETAFQESLRLIEQSADKLGLNLDSAIRTSKTIRCDHIRFRQILLNLLSNAVKYNREGGQISLICEDAPNGKIRISVTDTGEGISAEKLDGVFQPFDRLGQEATDTEGSGIGLTISKKLVELMQGEIGFDTKVGAGSTFWIEFPGIEANVAKTADPVVEQTSEHQEDASYVDATILYVEDNLANLRLMERIIKSMNGLTLVSAPDAETGQKMAEEIQPDLILMDINLPGMDGVEAKNNLALEEKTKDIPVIAISADAMHESVERAGDANFKAYLTKPFVMSELKQTLRRELP